MMDLGMLAVANVAEHTRTVLPAHLITRAPHRGDRGGKEPRASPGETAGRTFDDESKIPAGTLLRASSRA
jgi:hypothetical protein